MQGTDYPMHRDGNAALMCHVKAKKPNQSSQRKNQTFPEKVDTVQVPMAYPGEKSSLSYSLAFVTSESHSLNIKIC